MKLGQTWLIDKRTFEVHLEKTIQTQDERLDISSFSPFTGYETVSGLARPYAEQSTHRVYSPDE
jgi:hypothetical protein